MHLSINANERMNDCWGGESIEIATQRSTVQLQEESLSFSCDFYINFKLPVKLVFLITFLAAGYLGSMLWGW